MSNTEVIPNSEQGVKPNCSYSNLVHPSKLRAALPFEKFTFKYFTQSNEANATDDLLFSSLSPEILKKLNCKKMKKYPRHIDYYTDFASMNFIDAQMNRDDFLAKWQETISEVEKRKNKINDLIKNIKITQSNPEFCSFFFDEISVLIQNLFTESEKDKIITALAKLKESLKKSENNLKECTFDIFNAIEGHLSMLIDIIALRFKGNELALYLKEVMEILLVFKSKTILFKLLTCLKTHSDLVIEGTDNIIIDDIKDLAQAIVLKDLPDISKETVSISSLIAKYLIHPTVNNVKNVDYITFTANKNIAFVLFQIKDKVLYMKYNAKNKSFITMGFVPINAAEITHLNVALKNDILYIYYVHSNKLNVKLFSFDNFNLIDTKEYSIEGTIINVFNDCKALYAVTKENSLFTTKFKLNIGTMEKFTLSSKLDLNEVKMYNSLVANNTFYVYDKNNSILIASFKCDQSAHTATIVYEDTLNKKDEKVNVYLGKANLFYMYFNKETTEVAICKIKENSICGYGLFEKPFHATTAENLYQKLIMKYATYLSVYGNFDVSKKDMNTTLMASPQLYAFNINIKPIQFIIDGVVSQCSDKEKYVYVYILNQITNCLYNLNKVRSQEDKDKYMICDEGFKAVEAFIKKFISEYTETKEKRRILYLLGSIVRNINATSDKAIVDVNDVLSSLKKNDLSIKSKLCLLRVLLLQKSTRNDITIVQSICDIEKDIITSNKYEEYYNEYSMISNITNEIFNAFYSSFNKDKINQYYDIISANIIAISQTIKEIDTKKTVMLKSLFTFKSMLLLIQYLTFKKDKTFLSSHLNSLIDVIISLNSIEIKENNVFDLENIYEFESSHPFRVGKGHTETVKFDSERTVMIKTDVKNSEIKNIEKSFTSSATTKNQKIPFEISKVFNGIAYNIDSLVFNFTKFQDQNRDEYGVKYQIIPFKKDIDVNTVDFTLNEGKEMLSLIEQSLIHYVIYISKLEEEKEKPQEEVAPVEEVDLSSIYANKIMQCITMPSADKDIIDLEGMINKISDSSVRSKLLLSFTQYQSEESQLIAMKNYTDIDFNTESNKKVLNKLNETLSKKNAYLSRLGGEKILPTIITLFKIIIKYYNMNAKYTKLVEDVEKNVTDTPIYETFLSIWTECSKVRTQMSSAKSLIAEKIENDDEIDAKMNEYIANINSKASFVYDIIIPMSTGKFEASTVNKVTKLIFDETFDIERIKAQSMTQNKKCLTIYNHLLIVNIILASITKEDNINIILSEINSLYRKRDKLTSFSDDLTGADYINIDRVKNMFHFFLDVIEDKISNAVDTFKPTTKINLYQCLIWKIKGRDFDVLSSFVELFSLLLKERDINSAKASALYKPNFGVAKYGKGKVYDMLLEVFKIFVMQVLYRIKSVLTTDKDAETSSFGAGKGMLKKQVSKIMEADYILIIDFIISFYASLTIKNAYHSELIMVLYKSLINEDEIINLIKSRPNSKAFFGKIIETAVNSSDFITKITMLKLISLLLNSSDNNEGLIDALFAHFNKDNKEIENKNDFVYDNVVALLKKESNHVIKTEIAKVIKALKCSESKLVSVLNEANLFDVIVHLVDVKLNPLAMSSKMTITNNESRTKLNIYEVNEFKDTNNKYIIAFAPDTSKLITDEISLYHNKNAKKVFYLTDIDPKSTEITIKEAKIEEVTVINEFDKNDKFISTNATKIIDIIIAYFANNKNVYNLKTFIALKILMKLTPLATTSQAKAMATIMIGYITAEGKEHTFRSLEYIEKGFINDYINDNYDEDLIDKDLFSLEFMKIFTFQFTQKSLEILLRNKRAIFNLTYLEKENEKYALSSVESISFENDIRDNSFLIVSKITKDTLSLIEKNKDKIKAILFNTSDIDRYQISLPMFWIDEDSNKAIIDFFSNGVDYKAVFANAFTKDAKTVLSPKEEEKKDEPIEDPFESITKGNLQGNERKKAIIALLKENINSSVQSMLKLLAKRIILLIITQHIITIEDIDALIKNDKCNPLTIYRSLTLEYYFNMNYPSIANDEIHQLITNFLSSLKKDDKIDIAFINSFIEYYSSVSVDITKAFDDILKSLLFNNKQNESEVIFGKTNLNYNIVYESVLALLKQNTDFSVIDSKKFHDFIMNILAYHQKLTDVNYELNIFISQFLLSFIDIVYDIISNKKTNYQLYIDIFGSYYNVPQFDIKAYLDSKFVPLYKTNLLQYIFKFFDLCFLLLVKYNLTFSVDYWLQSNKEIFSFYLNYKTLYISKYINSTNNVKEVMTMVAHNAKVLNYFISDKEISEILSDSNKAEETKIQIAKGAFAEIELKKEKENLSLVEFKRLNRNTPLNYKLSTFAYSENDKKYYLQDIISSKDISNDNKYTQSYEAGTKLAFSANQNISTKIFAFGCNYSHALGIDGIIGKDYDEPQECKGLSSSTWDFNYGFFYAVALDEKTSEVYSCGSNCGAGLKSRSIKTFSNKNRINDTLKGNIEMIATGNCNASLILTKDGTIYAVGDKDTPIFKDAEDQKIKIPMKIEQIPLNRLVQEKITSITLNYKNAFAITSMGRGYGLGDNLSNQISPDDKETITEWTSIPLPEKTKRFVKCAIGQQYMLFIIEDSTNKHLLYSIGYNSGSCCGVGKNISKLKQITQCKNTGALQFKSIFARNSSSAAITTSGKLYIFGDTCIDNCEYPTLVDIPGFVIVDDVALCTSHILVLGREKINGVYVRKVFTGGNSKHFGNGKENKMHEIEFFTNNEEAVPIKVKVGYDRSYVMTVNAKEILNNKSDVDDTIVMNTAKEGGISNKLMAFYKSSKCDRFMNLYKSVTKSIMTSYISLLEEEDEAVKKDGEVDFDLFLSMITREKYRNLRMIFSIDDSNIMNKSYYQGLFEVVKFKIKLINQYILKFVTINEGSEDKTFLQKAINDNLTYISSDTRVEQFRTALESVERHYTNDTRIEIDRFKAHAFYDKKVPDKKFEETIFAQFYNCVKNIPSKEYFIHVGSRLGYVRLEGEHAIDQGGPYHECFSNFCQELESEHLDLFIKTPNNKSEVGVLKDKWMVNPSNTNELYDAIYLYLGKLMASAISSGELLDLNIHPILWKFILGNEITFDDTETLDCLFFKMIMDLEMYVTNEAMQDDFEYLFDLNFTFKNANNEEIELIPNGKEVKVTVENLAKFIDLSKKAKINESSHQMELIKKGFNEVLDLKICQILTWKQLEEYVCGKHKLDVNFLKENTEYREYNEKDPLIQWFWEWLNEIDDDMKIMYLKFVWGKTRLPKKENLGTQHKIDILSGGDGVFPHAATCFFKIKIPRYSSKKVLVDKLTYSIMNCTEIDGD